MNGFTVEYRNPGHWDIYQNDERKYQIRGMRGSCWVYDRSSAEPVFKCKTVSIAMGYIGEQLMYEEN